MRWDRILIQRLDPTAIDLDGCSSDITRAFRYQECCQCGKFSRLSQTSHRNLILPSILEFVCTTTFLPGHHTGKFFHTSRTRVPRKDIVNGYTKRPHFISQCACETSYAGS